MMRNLFIWVHLDSHLDLPGQLLNEFISGVHNVEGIFRIVTSISTHGMKKPLTQFLYLFRIKIVVERD